jgi:hypothetical protein
MEHVFACDPDTFWNRAFFAPEYNRKLYLERLRFERWEELERVDTPDGFRRVIEAVPRVGDLPGPIKALLKQGVGYREEGEYFRSQSRYVVRVVPSSLADRLDIRAEISVRPEGNGSCRRTNMTSAQAKVFGVGGMLETRILDDVDKSTRKSAEFTEQWLRELA